MGACLLAGISPTRTATMLKVHLGRVDGVLRDLEEA